MVLVLRQAAEIWIDTAKTEQSMETLVCGVNDSVTQTNDHGSTIKGLYVSQAQ